MEITLYKMDGSKSGNINIPEALFGVTPDIGLIHEVIVAQDANSRIRIAKVKDRSEVRGGGKKPWKQKGTGRARHGSSRSPIWIGGGVTFGPDEFRNFSKKINKKAKQKALAMILSDKVAEELLVVIDGYALPEPKTKFVESMRKNLPGKDASALVVVTPEDKDMKQAASNLQNTEIIYAKSLNVRDLVKFQYVICSKDALEIIQETYSK